MIFYFSGTGNSLYVARNIANHIGEELVTIITDGSNHAKVYEYSLKENETVGFIFPVYAWGAPKIVVEFIEKLKLNNYSSNNYTFCVITCGDSIGNAMKGMEDRLSKKGIQLHSGFSVAMPNNYVIMGDIDSKEIEQQKIEVAEDTLKDILYVVKQRERGKFAIKKGSNPWLLTTVINPLFNKFATDTRKFYATDNCTSCGICEKVCKCNNIKIDDKSQKPQWSNHCTQCLSCIHYCPAKAVQYGKNTESKGRYTNPKVNVSEMIKVHL